VRSKSFSSLRQIRDRSASSMSLKEQIRSRLASLQLRALTTGYTREAAVLIPIFEKDGEPHFLLTLRTDKVETHKGQISFPGGMREAGESLEECLVREVGEELGIEIQVSELLTTVEHAYTHFRITLYAYHCYYVRGEPRNIGCTAWKWVTLQGLADYAFPAANHAIIKAIQKTCS